MHVRETTYSHGPIEPKGNEMRTATTKPVTNIAAPAVGVAMGAERTNDREIARVT